MELDSTAAESTSGASAGRSGAALRGATIGRYVVLDALGAGAMGVVYAAYDPELDRKVAIKMVATADGVTAAQQARLLREAQALARLAHPNVVGVFDAGVQAGTPWIAMEFIAGQTLGAWARTRAWRWQDILPLLVDAARGVAAAHAVGLVHRDLKPDNVMVGRDLRARVMDFGLVHGLTLAVAERELAAATLEERGTTSALALAATAEVRVGRPELAALELRLTREGGVLGTPAYMAPEQWRGEEAEPLADQFSWCVMAWELLYGRRPFAGPNLVSLAANVLAGQRRAAPRGRRVPGWLRQVVERGLAADAARRWPSMEALLDALARGRSRARVRWAGLVLAILGVAIGGGLIGRHAQASRQAAACAAEGAAVADVWSDEVRARVRDALLATGTSYAAVTAEKVMPWLDHQAEALQAARTEVCLDATLRGKLDAADRERAVWCLDEQLLELDSLVTVLVQADAGAVERAVPSATRLADVAVCRDSVVLARLPAPPTDQRDALAAVRAELARAHSRIGAGGYEAGLTAARAALARAEGLGWPPLIAAAREEVGRGMELRGDIAESEAVLEDAYFEAIDSGAWGVAADVAIHMIHLVGYQLGRTADARRWSRHAAASLRALGEEDGARSIDRLALLAGVLTRAGDHAEARSLLEEVTRHEDRLFGPEHPRRVSTLNDIGILELTTGAYAEARPIFQRMLAIQEATLGAGHPKCSETLNNLAIVASATGDAEQARRLFARALENRERALAADSPEVAMSLNNLGLQLSNMGDLTGAKPLLARALAIWERRLGPNHPDVATALINLGYIDQVLGARDEARRQYERGLAIQEKALGPDHLDVAVTLLKLGELAYTGGDTAAARGPLERARSIWTRVDHPLRGSAMVDLAAVELSEGRPAAAAELAEEGVQVLVRGGLAPDLVARGQFVAARALWLSGERSERERARELAAASRDGYRAAPGAEKNLAEVESWLTAHRP